MRKRQKPYVLIMIIVIGGTLVAFMNTPPSKPHPNTPDPTESPKTGVKDVPVQSKDDLKNNVKEVMKATPKAPGRPGGPPGREQTDGPVVLRPKSVPYHPTPNASSTAGQWYEKDAAKSYEAPQSASPSAPPTAPGSAPIKTANPGGQ